ncbi:type I-E CRISPR-associated protein Cse2/CasB [Streptomyces sp. MAR4 CNY-716]
MYIRRLQYGYREDAPAAVATLARLRRGAGRPVLDVPDLWGMTGIEELAELPEGERRGLDLDRAEQSLHLCLTLWALHQQGHRDTGMHVRRRGLGWAVRELMTAHGTGKTPPATTDAQGTGNRTPAAELNEPLRRRLVRAGTAGTPGVLAQRLREIVLLLRREAVPLDYGLLADQLYRWQQPAHAAQVRRAWGRDFHLAALTRTKPSASDA